METLRRQIQEVTGFTLNAAQMAAFQRYEQELLAWNARFNLTAIRDVPGIRSKHFLDSLTCTLAWGKNPPASLIDIGTGAGFPGIPLKIACPSLKLTLVESVGKKVAFCRHIVETLNMKNVTVIQARAEELGQHRDHREAYDWAVARAVANLPILAEYLLPLVRTGGVALAQKGEDAPAEAHAAERAIQVLGGKLRKLTPVELPGVADDRFLVVIDKVHQTPPGYPRRVGLPAKKPIV